MIRILIDSEGLYYLKLRSLLLKVNEEVDQNRFGCEE